jgi:hypothetical protein
VRSDVYLIKERLPGNEEQKLMDIKATFETIRSQPDGPVKKFELLKVFGKALRESGVADPRVLSCEEIESKIADGLGTGPAVHRPSQTR